MSAAPKFLVAGLAFALLGGALFLSGVVPPDEAIPPAALASEEPTAEASVEPAPTASVTPTVVEPTPTPWVPPVVEPAPGKRILWPATSVVFEADDLRIRARGKTFKGGDPEYIRSWAGVRERTFDVEWHENKVLMRMNIEMDSDDEEYWISAFRVYDGDKGEGRWVDWKGPLLVTPLDRPMEGDLRLRGGRGEVTAKVDIPGLRITAFHPGSGPAALTGCTSPTTPEAEWVFGARGLDGELRLDDWVEPEHQFKGSGIWTMSPAEVEAFLRESGVCFDFEYSHPMNRDGGSSSWASERWCTAPPAGDIFMLRYGPDLVTVRVRHDVVRARREVPPQGWNCPTI